MKKGALLIVVILLMVTISACGSQKSASDSSTHAAGAKQEAAVPAEYEKAMNESMNKDTVNEQVKPAEEGRKIIYTATSAIDVKDLKGTYNSIIGKTEEIGGYIANSSIRDVYSQITVRIPAAKLDDFLKYIDTLGGENKETSVSTNDITDQYTDIESRLRNLKAQEEQLLAIMKKANTVEETLKVQSELFRVRGEIESFEGKINMWDKLIEYSTVTVKINKVQEIGEKEVKVSFISFGEIIRGMSNGFKMTLNLVVRFVTSIFIVLASLVPVIPFAAIAAWLIIRLRKKSKKDINQ